MVEPRRVALVGFTSFERSTFESFFRLASRRTPAYAYTDDLQRSQLVIADSDREPVMAELAATGRLETALLIGAKPRQAGAQLSRPMNLLAVMRELDRLSEPPALARPQMAAPSAPTTPAAAMAPHAGATASHLNPPGATPSAFAPVGISPLTWAQPARPAAPIAAETGPGALYPLDTGPGALRALDTGPGALRGLDTTPGSLRPVQAPPAAAARPSVMDHILVVDDSDVALRFMTKRLNRFGYEIHLARSGEEALQRMEHQHFEFVFLDVMMEGMDGYQTCKMIKRRQYPYGRQPPTVVMVTSLTGAMDKIRGTLAGCDAYLTKPLVDNDLLKVIGDREVVKHQFVDTTRNAVMR